MTAEQLLYAINASGLTAEQLTVVLSYASALVARERIRAAIAKARQDQSAASQAKETEIQALEAEFATVEAQLAAQA